MLQAVGVPRRGPRVPAKHVQERQEALRRLRRGPRGRNPPAPRGPDRKGGRVMTPAELERLAILVEELGEAAQAAGKALRFGYEGHLDVPNRTTLAVELSHVQAAIELMVSTRDLDLTQMKLSK